MITVDLYFVLTSLDLDWLRSLPNSVPAIALVAGGIVLVGVLLFFFLRKMRLFRREIQLKEQFLSRLEEELRLKENLQGKALGAIAEIRDASPRIRDLFVDTVKLLNVKSAAMVYQDSATGTVHHFSHPKDFLDPDALLSWLKTIFYQDKRSPWLQVRPDEQATTQLLISEATANWKTAVVLPISRRDLLLGGIWINMDNEELIKRREADLQQVNEIFSALISYRTLQTEIVQSAEEANALSAFLSDVALFSDVNKLFEGVYNFLRANYPQSNLALLLTDRKRGSEVSKGVLQDEKLIKDIIPAAIEESRKGRPILYFPDPVSLAKKFNLSQPPERTQAVLILPLVTSFEVFGFLVFESPQCNPFKINALTTLIRISEITSFLLGKTLFFKNEAAEMRTEMEHLRQETGRLSQSLEEREVAIKAMSDLNSVFSMVQSVRSNLATLRGSLMMLEENARSVNPRNFDPVPYRNSLFEVDKVEKNIRKFELVRVLADSEFNFKPRPVDPTEFFGQLFTGLRTRAMAKKIEFDNKWDAGLRKINIDHEFTSIALAQFFERLLDLVSDGKLQNISVVGGGGIQLITNFIPHAIGGSMVPGTFLTKEFTNDFNYTLLNRVLSLQNGNLMIEISKETGFVICLTFPALPA